MHGYNYTRLKCTHQKYIIKWSLHTLSLNNKFFHELCSKSAVSNAICQLCLNEKDISTERSQASESLKRQATRMRNRSEKNLTEVDIG